MSQDFTIADKQIGPWLLPVVALREEERSLAVAVLGLIGNSITTSKAGAERTRSWKRLVCATAKSSRGAMAWNPSFEYVISVGFSFHLPSHGDRALDVENFVKPVIDALAAGLFCSEAEDPRSIPRFDYDDSNFRHLFIHCLTAASEPQSEGVAIFVSGRRASWTKKSRSA